MRKYKWNIKQNHLNKQSSYFSAIYFLKDTLRQSQNDKNVFETKLCHDREIKINVSNTLKC